MMEILCSVSTKYWLLLFRLLLMLLLLLLLMLSSLFNVVVVKQPGDYLLFLLFGLLLFRLLLLLFRLLLLLFFFVLRLLFFNQNIVDIEWLDSYYLLQTLLLTHCIILLGNYSLVTSPLTTLLLLTHNHPITIITFIILHHIIIIIAYSFPVTFLIPQQSPHPDQPLRALLQQDIQRCLLFQILKLYISGLKDLFQQYNVLLCLHLVNA